MEILEPEWVALAELNKILEVHLPFSFFPTFFLNVFFVHCSPLLRSHTTWKPIAQQDVLSARIDLKDNITILVQEHEINGTQI